MIPERKCAGVPGVEGTSFFLGGVVSCMCMCLFVYYSFRRRTLLKLRSSGAFIIPFVPFSVSYMLLCLPVFLPCPVPLLLSP